MEEFPPEIVQAIAIEPAILHPADILALSLTCRHLHDCLLAEPYTRELIKTLFGVVWCLDNNAFHALHILLLGNAPLPPFPHNEDEGTSPQEVLEWMLNTPPLGVDDDSTSWRARSLRLLLLRPDTNAKDVVFQFRTHVTVPGIVAAARAGWAGGVSVLLENHVESGSHAREADVDKALTTAARNNHGNVVSVLLADGRANPRARDSQCLRFAAEVGAGESLRLLLADGRADPRTDESVVLRSAALVGSVECVQALLDDGRANPAVYQSYALIHAVESEDSNVVNLFLEDGRSDPTTKKRLPLRTVRAALKQLRLDVGDGEYSEKEKVRRDQMLAIEALVLEAIREREGNDGAASSSSSSGQGNGLWRR